MSITMEKYTLSVLNGIFFEQRIYMHALIINSSQITSTSFFFFIFPKGSTAYMSICIWPSFYFGKNASSLQTSMKFNGKLISFCENLEFLYHGPQKLGSGKKTKKPGIIYRATGIYLFYGSTTRTN